MDLQLPMQSVPITTDILSLNLDQGEVYNFMWIQNHDLVFYRTEDEHFNHYRNDVVELLIE